MSSAPAKSAQPARTVTLITGDKVTVTPGTEGASATVSVQRRAGATGSVRTITDDTGTYVYPDEAESYAALGVLDRRLFNVTGLVAQGYDDEHAPALPLIITRDTDASRLADMALPGVAVKRHLTSVRADAVSADRAKAASLWTALVAPQDTANRKTADAPSLPGNIRKIWLDGKVKSTLADSTAQIGAPQVWDAGTIGTGVKVAVLDTGVDADHPDLQKRIVSSRSFVPGEDVTDRRGHGTHVASIIAGTGAASDGREKGVAPGADLAIGKVLSDSGSGTESGIIAGMEWAARTEHAKVISMSLGSSSAHTQTDPMSQSVNALSKETGALFVIAAGNSGPGPYTVNSPGTAAAALTVGAVDSDDRIAAFSSSGPREGDDGLKPDLTAPGVNVLAARSQYLSGEGPYTAKSGTSMATPHVAGAAALLVEKHPDWTGQQLKDALMSTSKATPDISAYRGGAGRADVLAAFRTQIVASGSVDTGLIKWSPDPQLAERSITYTNSGSSPVTLQLTLDRGESPSTLFTLGADQVTVPAHDSASVSVVFDPRGVPVGSHAGQVVARDGTGTVAAHTVLGITTESERHDLTLLAKDREGRPMAGTATLKAAEGPNFQFYKVPETGLTLHLPRDTYSVMMFKDVQGVHGPHSTGLALLGDPEIELTQDRTVAFDAARAHEVRALTPRPSLPTNTRVEYWRSFTSARPEPGTPGDWIESKMIGPDYDSVWAQPTPDKATHGGFAFTTRWRAPQTPLHLSHNGHDLDVLPQNGAKALPDGTTTADAVFAGTGTPDEYARLSAKGKAAVVRRSPDVTPAEQSQAARAAGVKLLLVVNNGTGRLNTWYGDADYESPGPVAVASVTQDEGEELIAEISASRDNRIHLRATAHPVPAYLYDLVSYHTEGIPADPTYRADARNLAQVNVTFGQGENTPATETRMDYPPYVFGGGWNFLPGPVARGPRTDWVSTGDSTWQQKVSVPNVLSETSEPVAYPSAGTHEDRWLTPVLRPRMINEDLPVRQDGSALAFRTRAWGDSGTAHAGEGYGSGLSQRTSLYQGDTLLAESDYDSGYAWDLSPDRLPYRLVVDATSDNASLGPYSPTTHTEWTFFSAEAAERTIPLVQLDYGVDLDAEGKARRTADLALMPSVLGAPKTGVSSVKLEVSYDDGATWRRQNTLHHGGTWKTLLAAPDSASFVSLRTTAKDESGGSVTQTVLRAYGLK
ncbi:S8 family serine peptidase [Streptomyces sp. NBC_00687]|uniref:S8 family serine peptidase n=1 Tax=Streptomyces sp. NBC_00687 TaxID=2975807 RepID=UPI002258B241|nr:S8 family serine peptidase [Streptomyces sp. NBC_00687]MCX4912007.1 S8 family serine peptidase [Streptomyces sp. NBC_00687]